MHGSQSLLLFFNIESYRLRLVSIYNNIYILVGEDRIFEIILVLV